jgi:hypothetical protein
MLLGLEKALETPIRPPPRRQMRADRYQKDLFGASEKKRFCQMGAKRGITPHAGRHGIACEQRQPSANALAQDRQHAAQRLGCTP